MSRDTALETDPLAAGHAALARADWAEARVRFEQAVAADGTPEAWEGLGRAVWWLGDQDATFAARERAYRGYRQVRDARGAARMAMWVASDHLDFRGDAAVASAWLRRGWALVADAEPCTQQGWIILLEADITLLAESDPMAAERRALDALELARRI